MRTNRRQHPTNARHAVTILAMAALALAPAASGRFGVGDALVDEGRFLEAITAYEEILAVNADDARAHYRLARAAVYHADSLPPGEEAAKERLFARAVEHAERAAVLAPDDPEAHFEVARALGELAQYRGVLQSLNLAGRVSRALDRTLELDPDHGSAWHARAIFHREVPWIAGGRSREVIPAFERAIVSEPLVIGHRLELARVLIARGDPQAAREQLTVAVSLPATTYHDRLDLEEARALLASLP